MHNGDLYLHENQLEIQEGDREKESTARITKRDCGTVL